MAEFNGSERSKLRRIIGIGTSEAEITDLDARLSRLDDDEAANLRNDITAFEKIKYGTTKTRGGIKGTDFDIERERLHITNEVRRALNYPLLASADSNSLSFFRLDFGGTRGGGDEYSR